MKQNQRLSLSDWHKRYKQQAGWSLEVRRSLFEKTSIRPGDKILEVGSGTGAVLDIVSNETDSQPFGIDIDITSLFFSSKLFPAFHHTAANGFDLPFRDKTFSITYCHYLLLWLQNPLGILLEMIRVTRSGGLVIALAEPDYEARIDFPPSLKKLGQLQTESLVNQGVDPSMGRKLIGMFHQAGLEAVTAGIIGAQWDFDHSQTMDENEWMIIQSDLAEKLTAGELGRYRKAETRAREMGERVLFIPTFFAAGTVT